MFSVYPLSVLCGLCELCVRSQILTELAEAPMHENQISGIAIDCAIKIHKVLGPGLLESVYRAALAFELQKRGFRVAIERPIPAVYEDIHLELGFRADVVVDNKVIIETKSVEALAPIHGRFCSRISDSQMCALGCL